MVRYGNVAFHSTMTYSLSHWLFSTKRYVGLSDVAGFLDHICGFAEAGLVLEGFGGPSWQGLIP